MDADTLRTRTFIETYRMMRSKKPIPDLFTNIDIAGTPISQPSTIEDSVVLLHAKNSFLTAYDPLESI